MPTDPAVLHRLAGEIDDLGRRLGQVGVELRALGSEPQPVAAVPPPMPPPGYGWQVPPPPPQQWQQPPQQQWAPPPPRESLGARLGKEGAGSRLLAWVGGAVTLLGVVLFLVLAIQRGWLGPMPRVLLGAGLGLGLVGTGLWLHRNPAGRTGAFALAATGVAVLYLDVVAATTLYEFLPSLAGLAAGLVVAVGGLLLASYWDSALFATAVVVGCAVCAPMIVGGFTPELVAFLLVVQIATTPVHVRKEWPSVAVAAGIPPLLASVISTGVVGLPGSWANTAAALAVGAVRVVLSLIMTRRRPDDFAALALLAGSVVPILIAVVFLPNSTGAAVAAGAGLVLLLVWAAVKWLPGNAADVAGAAGLFAVMEATVIQFDGSPRSAILLGEAALLALLAWRSRRKVAMIGALGFGVLGAVLALGSDLPPTLLLQFRERTDGQLAGACLVAALLLLVSVALPWVATKLGALRGPSANLAPWVIAGIAALYGAAGMVLSGALLAQSGRAGFLLGHVLITVLWTVAALVLLIRGIDVVALRVIGLVLVGAAVVKLVLFDLSALDGMARVAAFLCAGLLLLAAGTRYARLVSSHPSGGGGIRK